MLKIGCNPLFGSKINKFNLNLNLFFLGGGGLEQHICIEVSTLFPLFSPLFKKPCEGLLADLPKIEPWSGRLKTAEVTWHRPIWEKVGWWYPPPLWRKDLLCGGGGGGELVSQKRVEQHACFEVSTSPPPPPHFASLFRKLCTGLLAELYRKLNPECGRSKLLKQPTFNWLHVCLLHVSKKNYFFSQFCEIIFKAQLSTYE